MPKNHDESNTLWVICCPDGSIRRAVSKLHVDNVFTGLELKVRQKIQEGTVDPFEFLALIQDAKLKIDSMFDPLSSTERTYRRNKQ